MNLKSTVFGAILLLAGLAAAQDSFNFERKYTLEESDSYVFKMSFSMQQMSIDVSVNTVQKVIKVYENGDADVESEVKEVKVLVNGSEMPVPADTSPKKKVSRVDKFGMSVAAASGAAPAAGTPPRQGLSGTDMTRYFNLGSVKSMKVGQTVDVNYSDPNESGRTVKGTATLENISDGVAKIVANVTVAGKDMTQPMTVRLTSFMDVASKKANKVEGTITNISGGPMPIDSAQFSMVRQKT